MRALVLTGAKRFELREVAAPSFDGEDALVRVAACGICGSDVHGMDGSTGRRIPPVIMGHEASGTIAELGGYSNGWRVGDRVTFDSTIFCGQCAPCLRGATNLCANRQVLGVSCGDYRRDGAFAELVAVPLRALVRLPDAVAMEHAAMVEPISVAAHAVARAPLSPADSVVVVGVGMIGLLIVQVLRAKGVTHIVAADVSNERLELARRFGARDVIDASKVDVARAVLDTTGGEGADAAFEVVGAGDTLAAAVGSVRKGGHVVLVGNLAASAPLPLQSVVTREITLHGSCASNGEYAECLAMLASGAIDIAPLISAVAPLDEGAAWFERLYNREPGLLKVVLRP